MSRWSGATVGTIVMMGIVAIVIFSLLFSLIVSVVNTADVIKGQEPTEPVLVALYTPLYTIYVYMKAVLSNDVTVAVLIAVSILLLALEMKWRKGYF